MTGCQIPASSQNILQNRVEVSVPWRSRSYFFFPPFLHAEEKDSGRTRNENRFAKICQKVHRILHQSELSSFPVPFPAHSRMPYHSASKMISRWPPTVKSVLYQKLFFLETYSKMCDFKPKFFNFSSFKGF